MKVLAIASSGGHWVQLLRLKTAFKDHDLMFASTTKGSEVMVKGHQFFHIPDTNRNNYLSIIKTTISITKILIKNKPKLIITTGAAPGLLAILIGKSIGIKTIWIDSIANVETISMSGKIAMRFADRVYTQWPDLATDKIIFRGNIL